MTQERLKELLDYDPETGVFEWRVDRGGSVKAGRSAGGIDRKGYVKIVVDGRAYRGHRLAWLYVYGRFPAQETDHINLIKADNRISNLREATRSNNCANKKPYRSGLKCAYWKSRIRRWTAQIRRNGVLVHLGCFKTELEAHERSMIELTLLHGDFARAK